MFADFEDYVRCQERVSELYKVTVAILCNNHFWGLWLHYNASFPLPESYRVD